MDGALREVVIFVLGFSGDVIVFESFATNFDISVKGDEVTGAINVQVQVQ